MPRIRSIVGQKPATLATGDDLVHDEQLGVTNPNLHRRVELSDSLNEETAPREYLLGVYGTHSYRTTIVSVHSDNSTTSEVP